MKTWSKAALLVILTAVGLASGTVWAGAWGAHGPKTNVVTLIVAANYEEPRLLAELIQLETRQPILLLPAKIGDPIYFCPPSTVESAKALPKGYLPKLVPELHPQLVLVLGDQRYVPQNYLDAFGNSAPVAIVYADTWQKVANRLTRGLNLIRLDKNFAAQLKKLREPKTAPPVAPGLIPAPASDSAAPKGNAPVLLPAGSSPTVGASSNLPAASGGEADLLPGL